MKTMRDPSLPLLELQDIMTSVSGRIPPAVEKAIKKEMAQYASNITSVLCQYRSGIRGHMKAVVMDLLRQYLKVEIQFQNGEMTQTPFVFLTQVLIASHLPSYELRHNQVESIFLSAIDMYGHQFCIENLQVVRMAALEVYVRRAYIAYELNSVQHRQLKDNTCVVEFQFMLPTSHPNR
ncbi:hypothetical protein GOODEAATRI_004759 [Goodea atripinnis]|uniref:Acetyl-CoA carboxylase central domain-containing protein n=1 Tax=Goodea atripinnis TaxID=208336 RepID=A0ABV0P4D0_9TELE